MIGVGKDGEHSWIVERKAVGGGGYRPPVLVHLT